MVLSEGEEDIATLLELLEAIDVNFGTMIGDVVVDFVSRGIHQKLILQEKSSIVLKEDEGNAVTLFRLFEFIEFERISMARATADIKLNRSIILEGYRLVQSSFKERLKYMR
jgi:hypothetical protein